MSSPSATTRGRASTTRPRGRPLRRRQRLPRVVFQLFPFDEYSSLSVKDAGCNPLLQLSVPGHRKLVHILDHLEVKWRVEDGLDVMVQQMACAPGVGFRARWKTRANDMTVTELEKICKDSGSMDVNGRLRLLYAICPSKLVVRPQPLAERRIETADTVEESIAPDAALQPEDASRDWLGLAGRGIDALCAGDGAPLKIRNEEAYGDALDRLTADFMADDDPFLLRSPASSLDMFY